MKVLIFYLFLSLFGKYNSEKRISYRDLSWADYCGKVPASEPTVQARTMTQLELTTIETNETYQFVIRAYFLPDSSFVRLRQEYVLRHEQTHFKIAQIAALECSLKLALAQNRDTTMLRRAVALYDDAYAECNDLNDRFDAACRHGQDTAAENKWEKEISLVLANLEAVSKKLGDGIR